MSLIDWLPKIEKREDPDLKRFTKFLRSKGFQMFVIMDKPDETLTTATTSSSVTL